MASKTSESTKKGSGTTSKNTRTSMKKGSKKSGKDIKSKKKEDPKLPKEKKTSMKQTKIEITKPKSQDAKKSSPKEKEAPKLKNTLAIQVLERYKKEYGKEPQNANQLVKYGKKTSILVSYDDAKKIMGENLDLQQKYQIGDQVLITKDRTAIVRYYGNVDDIGSAFEKFYGIELTGGSLGTHNGSLNGVKYFETEQKDGNFGLFVRPGVIRRKLTDKDHKRTQSWVEARNEKEELKQRGQLNKIVQDALEEKNEEKEPETVVEEKKEETTEMNQVEESKTIELDEEEQLPAFDADEKKEEVKKEEIKVEKKVIDYKPVVEEVPYTINEFGFSNVEPRENVLKYVLRQDGAAQSKLMDLYSHPATHLSFVDSFKQMRELKVSEQNAIWKELIPRWQKYLEK